MTWFLAGLFIGAGLALVGMAIAHIWNEIPETLEILQLSD